MPHPYFNPGLQGGVGCAPADSWGTGDVGGVSRPALGSSCRSRGLAGGILGEPGRSSGAGFFSFGKRLLPALRRALRASLSDSPAGMTLCRVSASSAPLFLGRNRSCAGMAAWGLHRRCCGKSCPRSGSGLPVGIRGEGGEIIDPIGDMGGSRGGPSGA